MSDHDVYQMDKFMDTVEANEPKPEIPYLVEESKLLLEIEQHKVTLRLLDETLDRLAKMTAERDACASQSRWRPISDAPPATREAVIVYRPDAGVFTMRYCEAAGDADVWCWFTTDGDDLTGDMPTHWMPLPEPPTEATP